MRKSLIGGRDGNPIGDCSRSCTMKGLLGSAGFETVPIPPPASRSPRFASDFFLENDESQKFNQLSNDEIMQAYVNAPGRFSLTENDACYFALPFI